MEDLKKLERTKRTRKRNAAVVSGTSSDKSLVDEVELLNSLSERIEELISESRETLEKSKEFLSKYRKAEEKSATVVSGTSSGKSLVDKVEELINSLSKRNEKLISEYRKTLKKSEKFLSEYRKTLKKSATVASGTSSGNTSNEEYEELSSSPIPGAAGLSSSSEILGQEIEELDHSVEDNVVPSKKRKIPSESEGPDKKRAKWQEFTSNKTSQSESNSMKL